jgi:hypothetical protein
MPALASPSAPSRIRASSRREVKLWLPARHRDEEADATSIVLSEPEALPA